MQGVLLASGATNWAALTKNKRCLAQFLSVNRNGDQNVSYLNITPEKGKWYISEGWKVSNEPLEMVAHNQRRSKMIVAGPFDTKQAAQSQLEHAKCYEPFVWLCEE